MRNHHKRIFVHGIVIARGDVPGEGYGFQGVYCGIGYTNREFGSSRKGYHFPGN